MRKKQKNQDIYLREESIFIQGYRQSERRITELEKNWRTDHDTLTEYNNKLIKEKAEFEKAYNETEEILDKQIEATYKLFEENKELKEKLKPENCLKLLAKEGYVKFTSDQLTYAKTII